MTSLSFAYVFLELPNFFHNKICCIFHFISTSPLLFAFLLMSILTVNGTGGALFVM